MADHHWSALRPDRPLPPGLVTLLEAVTAGRAPTDARVFRRTGSRGQLYGTVALMIGLVCVAIGLLFVLTPASAEDASWGPSLLGLGAFIVFGGVLHLVSGLRRRPRTFLVVSPRFIAYADDEDGVQWARPTELERVDRHKATTGSAGRGGGGTSTPTYLELLHREGMPERLFVDDEIEGDLDTWAEACEAALAGARRQSDANG